MTTPIPKEQIEAARRKVKRRVAAMLIYAMAEEDMSFEQIAAVLGDKAEDLRKYVYDLVEGRGNELNQISDLCFALDREPEFSMRRREGPLPAPVPSTPSE